MGRSTGSKNTSYEEKRTALARAVMPRLLADGGATSFNELAAAAGVSVPTLRHYFESRSGLIAAALRCQREVAKEHIDSIAHPGDLPLPASLTQFSLELIHVWRPFGVGRIFVVGLAVGAYDKEAGPGYLDGVLEPTLQAFEKRLKVHAQRGEIDISEDNVEGIRAASLAFLSPILLSLIHQDALFGASCRPLDMEEFAKSHIKMFLRSYATQKP